MKFLTRWMLLATLVATCGCATVFTGTHDKVRVVVTDCEQAHCKASNASGEWPIASADGEVVVRKDASALLVVCESEGLEPVAVSVTSQIEGWVWGNILIGGLVGVAIDFASDGLYDYRDEVEVPLSCEKPDDMAFN